MSSIKNYCLNSNYNNKTNNDYCYQLSNMYKAYQKNKNLTKDVNFNKEIIFTYHMVNYGHSFVCQDEWKYIDNKINNLKFKNIEQLENFYEQI